MDARESLRGAENLRFRFQMNNRLRLECLAAVSKVFREFGEPIADELLSSVVFALPQELVGSNDHGNSVDWQLADEDSDQAQRPGNPPEKPKPGPQPGNPPEKPTPAPRPGDPPETPKPALPESPSEPEEPDTQPLEAPGLPPEAPAQIAMGYSA